MMSKKIAIVIADLKGNGAERVALNLSKALIQDGHNCHLFNFKNFKELPVDDSIPRHCFPLKRFRWLPRSIRWRLVAPFLDRFITRHMGQPDLVLSNLMACDRILCHSALPVHIIVHSVMSKDYLLNLDGDERQSKITRIRKIYTAKPCIAVSKGVEDDFRQIFPEHSKISTIYNPIDVDNIQESAKQDLPDGLNLPTRYFLHIAKFNPSKNHAHLLKAYAQSKSQTPLLLLGQGGLFKASQQLAKDLKIDSRVHFLGFQASPFPIIAKAQCLILSSDFEGLGMVILEALALNTPAISTDCPSGPNEILPASNLAPVRDIEALATLIQKVDSDPSEFEVPFDSKFSMQSAADLYLKLCD